MENCIFCKIIKGEIPSVKIWENEKFLAILDVMPNSEGMTLVMPKQHHNSYLFDENDDFITECILVSKKVAKMLEKGLNVQRVALVMEGMGINHAHIKLYPLHGLDEKFTEMWAPDKIYFNKYEGYISTQTGPQKTTEELEEIAKKIRK